MIQGGKYNEKDRNPGHGLSQMQPARGASQRGRQGVWHRSGSHQGAGHQNDHELWSVDDSGSRCGWCGQGCGKASQTGGDQRVDQIGRRL